MNLFYSDLIDRKEMRELIRGSDIGLETIQFSVSENLDRFSETMEKEKEALAFLGNPKLTVHGPFLDLNPMSYDSRIQEITRQRFEQAWEGAAELGAEKIIFHSGMIPGIYYPEGWAERMADFWNRFLENKTGTGGPVVCMENVLDRKAEPFLEVCKRVESPDFGVCLDLGHVNCYSEDPAEVWIECLKGRIRHVHVHDNDGIRDLHRAAGSGTIQWTKVLPALIESNENLSWTIECADAGWLHSSESFLQTYG